MHSANLALRFFLEIAALLGFGSLVWIHFSGWIRVVVLVIVIAAVMTIWAVFAVPDDPSRSGNAPVTVPGLVRLILELLVLFGGCAAIFQSGQGTAAIVLALLVLVHYGLSSERIIWLLQQ